MASVRARLCCLDMDTFFVSVERVLEPSLVGKPVIVGGRPGQRGVVTACSYEVRRFGVRSGMSLTQASQLAPDATYLPVRGEVYGEYAAAVRKIAKRFSPAVQVASIDEMFIDFAGCEQLYRRPGDSDEEATVERVVRSLCAAIQGELGLPSSAGIATSRSVAKIASGLAKPAGVKLVRAGEEAALLAPLPVRKLPGIGPVAAGRLQELGIETLGELCAAPPPQLSGVFGARLPHVLSAARGAGPHELTPDRPAFREHDPVGSTLGTISNERTFSADVHSGRAALDALCSLCERVCYRARKRGVLASTLTLKLRYGDFQTLSRSASFSPSHCERRLLPVAERLFHQARTRSAPVRLVGIALSNLCLPSRQLSLFEDAAEARPVAAAAHGREARRSSARSGRSTEMPAAASQSRAVPASAVPASAVPAPAVPDPVAPAPVVRPPTERIPVPPDLVGAARWAGATAARPPGRRDRAGGETPASEAAVGAASAPGALGLDAGISSGEQVGSRVGRRAADGELRGEAERHGPGGSDEGGSAEGGSDEGSRGAVSRGAVSREGGDGAAESPRAVGRFATGTRLTRGVDAVRERFGYDALRLASGVLRSHPPAEPRRNPAVAGKRSGPTPSGGAIGSSPGSPAQLGGVEPIAAAAVPSS